MNLHNEIMNIPVPKSVIHNLEHPDCKDMFSAHSYKIGHRAARHAAAELSLKAEARIEELEFLLKEALPWLNHYEDCHGTPEEVTLLARIIEGKLK